MRRRPASAAVGRARAGAEAVEGGVELQKQEKRRAEGKGANKRPQSAASSSAGGVGQGVLHRPRPLTAGRERRGGAQQGLREAYDELEQAWASTYAQPERAQGRGGRPWIVPELRGLSSLGFVVSDEDDLDDVLVIDEDDEEGWEEEENAWGGGDVVDDRQVSSPAKPITAVVAVASSRTPEETRKEYVPSVGKKIMTFAPTAVGRPISAPAVRKSGVLRMTASGGLGGGRPRSAGPSVGQAMSGLSSAGAGGAAGLARRRAKGEDVKVFVMSGPFLDVRRGLMRRGWVENTCGGGPGAALYDLKWTLHDSEVGYASLRKGQMVNHFERNHELTTKGNFCRSLYGNMAWECDRDAHGCVPASFDVSDPGEWDAFVAAFKDSAVTSLLMLYSLRAQNGSHAAFVGATAVDAVRACVRHAVLKSRVFSGEGDLCGAMAMEEEAADTVLLLLGAARERARAHAMGGDGVVPFRDVQAARRVGIVGEEGEAGEEERLEREVEEALARLEGSDPQYALSGVHNVWVSKTGSGSKGVGVKLFDRLSQVRVNLHDAS